ESADAIQVEANDLLELKYKVWTVEELDKLGTLFDSSESTDNKRPFRMKLSNKGKVWHDMLIGMKAASQRFCLVPIELKDDFVGIVEKAVLYETTVMLAFELELIRIKPRDTKEHTTKQRSNTSTSVHSQEGDKRSDSVSSICAEDNVEHSKKSSKSDILSRVAKVGTQIMIPKKSKAVEEDKATEGTEMVETKEPKTEPTGKPLPKPRTNSLHNIHATEIPAMVSVPQPLYTAPTSTSTIQSTTFVPYAFNPLAANDNSVNRIMSEMNSNYSELRLNLSKITDKLESVMSKVDGLQ
ncbi:FK506-binding protein 15-like isoform X2, partial [Leptotrombidium deliense]